MTKLQTQTDRLTKLVELIGCVVLWGGTLADIPEDWAIVPGQKTDQVPGMITLVYIQKVR